MTGISTIDRFAVLDHLADGSFGPIHLGKDSTSDQKVVIKLCEVEDGGLRQRFFTEAEMAAKLKHTHVANVLAAGFHGETPYLVQEYLEGYDLEEIITQRRTWRGTDKLAVLMHVAQGMAYAHSQGVSHHDLKPSNVRISAGVAKVMDFGTSRLASTETHTTQRGVTLATASYLPPEQVRSGELDHRVDVFAFGSLAYELFTYQRPFRGQTLSALVYQILYKDPVPMASVWPDCPAPLNKLLTTCLAKDPELRYAGFPQVLAVLQSLHDDAAAGKHPALTVAVAALPAPEPEEDVMSQSMVTRTAASVGAGPMTSAAATQRIRQDGTPPDASSEASNPDPGPSKGKSAETVRLPALPDDDDASEDATVIMSKAAPVDPPPRPTVGATTRTEQPPEILERPKVGATTRTEQPEPEPQEAPGESPETPGRPRVGATTRTKQPASSEPETSALESPDEDLTVVNNTATCMVGAEQASPVATQPAEAVPVEAPPAEASAGTEPSPAATDQGMPPKEDETPSPTPSKPINTGKLALSAQEISALVAQGKLEEAQKHIQAMQQQGGADAAELPTTPMQRADGGSSPANPSPPAVPAVPASSDSTPSPETSATPSSEGAQAAASAKPTAPKPPAAPQPAAPQPATPQPAAPKATADSKSGVQSKDSSSTGAPKTGAPKTVPPKTVPPKTPSKSPTAPPAKASSTQTPPIPGQKTLDRSAAPPSPAPKAKERGGPPVALLAGLGMALFLVLAAAGWWFFGRAEPEAPPPVAEVPRPQPAPAAPAGEAEPMGQVLVDASPWGALTEITDGSGYLLELPADNVTPMVLELPEGTYNLVLSRGTEEVEPLDGEASEGLDAETLGELQSCEVEVSLDAPATCRVRFEPPSVTDYFKDAGWWQ